jgi:hypothetical protein
VISRLTDDFVARFKELPDSVKEQARKSYRLWKKEPTYPSLRFKKIHMKEGLYSVRVGHGWRALGLREGNSMTWFWIGSHADYNRLLSRL